MDDNTRAKTMTITTVTYISPTGRKLAQEFEDRQQARQAARKIARKPGMKNVRMWSEGGHLIAAVEG
jgi:hypothetical protein